MSIAQPSSKCMLFILGYPSHTPVFMCFPCVTNPTVCKLVLYKTMVIKNYVSRPTHCMYSNQTMTTINSTNTYSITIGVSMQNLINAQT